MILRSDASDELHALEYGRPEKVREVSATSLGWGAIAISVVGAMVAGPGFYLWNGMIPGDLTSFFLGCALFLGGVMICVAGLWVGAKALKHPRGNKWMGFAGLVVSFLILDVCVVLIWACWVTRGFREMGNLW